MRPRNAWILAAASFACTSLLAARESTAQAAATAPDVTGTLQSVREALGWDELQGRGGLIRVTGSAHMLGTEARQVDLFDSAGRFVQSFDGELGSSTGFDGATAWNVDWNRTPRVLELGNRDSSLFRAALLSGFWTTNPDWLSFGDVSHAGDELRLEFVHANGALAGSVRLDPESFLPVAITWRSGDADSHCTFGSFEERDGFRFPRSIALKRGAIEQSFELESLEWLASPAAGDSADDSEGEAWCAPRLEAPNDTRFDPDAPAALEVERVPSGHLLVRPRLNGKDLGWFIFDTGAGTNCIAREVADELGGEPFGEVAAQGIGGTVTTSFRRAERVTLGPLTIDEVVFMELELGFLSEAFGVPIGGIVGYELISRCAVEYDQAESAIALHDPATYELPEGARWEEVLLLDRHPNVVATFEGREAVFKIDTGAAGDTVSLYHGAVEAGALLEGRETVPGQAGGVGGHVPIRVGEVSSFVFGGREVGPFEASFATQDKGAFSNDYVWGHVGGLVLAEFVLVFDYGNKRLGFVPK